MASRNKAPLHIPNSISSLSGIDYAQHRKTKTINLSTVNARGELETLYRWIGGDPQQIKHECIQQPPQGKWQCICTMTYNRIIFKTAAICLKKKVAIRSASLLMINKMLTQHLPIPLHIIDKDGSSTFKNVSQSPSRDNLITRSDMAHVQISDNDDNADIDDAKAFQNEMEGCTEEKDQTLSYVESTNFGMDQDTDIYVNNNDIVITEVTEHDNDEKESIICRKEHDLQIDANNTVLKPMHIASFISKPFHIRDDAVSCFIYHIAFQDDPYRTPIGIVISTKIDERYLKSIKFSVQIRKDEEEYWKELIAEWVENKKELQDSVQFGKKRIHTTNISLHIVKTKGGNDEHKLRKEVFAMMKKFDRFMFETLDQKSVKKDDDFDQKRFLIICPLKNAFVGSDNMEIHTQCIERICLGSGDDKGKRLNAKEFRKELNSNAYCNLKKEIVEIMDPKKKKKTIAITYGVDKQKFDKIRSQRDDHKDEDEKSIASLASFPEPKFVENVDKLKQINKTKLLQTAPKLDIVLVRAENAIIENVLVTWKDKEITEFELKCQIQRPTINHVFPTGITSNLWYKLKTLPAILYRIECWMNVIDLEDALLRFKEEKGDELQLNSLNIDLSLKFEAMHRSPSTTRKNHQILKYIGSRVLKYISTLHSFVNYPKKTTHQISIDVFNESHQQIADHDSQYSFIDRFFKAAKQLDLMKYAIFRDFNYNNWNPAQFKERNNSLYYIKAENNKYLESNLLQSIIGAEFISITEYATANSIHYALNQVSHFLKHLGILNNKKNNNNDDDDDDYIPRANCVETNAAINKLKEITITNELKMNAMLEKSLKIVIENNEDCKRDGITFNRLKILGESIHDLLIGFFICTSLKSHLYNEDVGNTKENKANFSEYISEHRDIWCNNNYLGYRFVKGGLDQYMLWFDVKTRNVIGKYKKTIDDREQTQNKNGNVQNEIALIQTIKSPGGWTESKSKDDWSLEVTAPYVLGGCYKALLGAIFVGCNADMFEKQIIWNIKPCVQFMITFLGNHDNWKSFDWKKYT